MPKSNYKNLLVPLFFLSYLFLGLLLYRDFGTSIDEPFERLTSHRQYKVAYSKALSLFGVVSQQIGSIQLNQDMLREHRDRYYGSFLSWPLVAIEHYQRFQMDNREIFAMRHLYNFIHHFMASIALYAILYKRFRSQRLALIGPLILIFSPRFFSESFYNNKDILFFAWYLISLWAGVWFIEKPSLIRTLLSGLIIGIAINTRIAGLVLLPLIGLIIIIKSFSRPKNVKTNILSLALLIFSSVSTYLISSPTAWGSESVYFSQIFKAFRNYDWTGSTLYFGRLIPYNEVPWHFTLGYLFVTTPIFYSLLFLSGVIVYLKQIGNRLFKYLNHSHISKDKFLEYDLLMFLSFAAPLASIIFLHPVLYNSWRHSYFLYGPFIYFCVWFIAHQVRYKKFLIAGTIFVFAITGTWMIRNHPYQYAYFNPMFAANAYQNFERDYWGVATLELVDYILENHPNPKIKMYRLDYSRNAINGMINKDEFDRFVFTDTQNEADYAIYQYYNSTQNSHEFPGFKLIRSIAVDGNQLMSLYKKFEID